MDNAAKQNLLAVGVFAVAMAFVESSVVVYLRQLYYPGGFAFPLKAMAPALFRVEWIREASTLVMLGAVGVLAGRKFHERLAYFLWAFALWDALYYAWLWAILRWPASLLTWDLLFLIPWPWLAPVLAPLLCSAAMVALAFAMLARKRGPGLRESLLLALGNAFVLVAFLRDYAALIFKGGFWAAWSAPAASALASAAGFVPAHFDWGLFAAGQALYLAVIASLLAGPEAGPEA